MSTARMAARVMKSRIVSVSERMNSNISRPLQLSEQGANLHIASCCVELSGEVGNWLKMQGSGCSVPQHEKPPRTKGKREQPPISIGNPLAIPAGFEPATLRVEI
jgi:hypothetical protein